MYYDQEDVVMIKASLHLNDKIMLIIFTSELMKFCPDI